MSSPRLRQIPSRLQPRRLSLSKPFRRHSLHHDRPREETVRIFARRAKTVLQPGNEAVPLPQKPQVIRMPRILRLTPPAGLDEVLLDTPETVIPLAAHSILRAILEARDWREHFPMPPPSPEAQHHLEPDLPN
jgi:hypothetical protein